jgi:putative oxidoreductase
MSSQAISRPQTSSSRPQAVPASASAFLVPVARLFFTLIFLLSGPRHFTQAAIGYAAAQGVPFASFLVPASGVLAVVGALSVLLGYRARIGAWLLILFLVPVTFMMHNFWTIADPMMQQMQMAMFMKNVALIGGALLIWSFGSGPYSLDGRSD